MKKIVCLVVCSGMLLLGLVLAGGSGPEPVLAAKITQPENDKSCITESGTMFSKIKWRWEIKEEEEVHVFFKDSGGHSIEKTCNKKYKWPTQETSCLLTRNSGNVKLIIKSRLKDEKDFRVTHYIECERDE